jgi:hypothetical protein
MGRERKGKVRARKWFWLSIGGKSKLGRVIEKGRRSNGLRLQTERLIW